jgi:redox-sensitive bicupin YhaK (pirin superfamily)
VVDARARVCLELQHGFEYGALLASGDAVLLGTPVSPNTLYYLGAGRNEIAITSEKGARLILLGGTPFAETILMWWNFVARSAEEIAKARSSWEDLEASHAVFGNVGQYRGPRLPAPAFLGRPIRNPH